MAPEGLVKSGGELDQLAGAVERRDGGGPHPRWGNGGGDNGIPHHQWGERPILIVQRSAGAIVTADEIRAHLAGTIAAWWMPDEDCVPRRDAPERNGQDR